MRPSANLKNNAHSERALGVPARRVLAALNPKRLALGDLGPLMGLSSGQNKCEYKHGFLPQARMQTDVGRYVEKTRDIVARARGGKGALERLLPDHRFPKLAAGTVHEV
jgi:ribosomal protein L34